MGLLLTASNRMEALVAALAVSLDERRRAAPLTPITIVVPNRAVAQYVRFRAAEILGIAANLDFVFLRRYLAERVERAAPDVRILDANTLHLLLFRRLRAAAGGDDPDLAPVRAYLGEGGGDETEVRALQLAGQLAHLFEEYGYSRRELLESWRGGTRLDDTAWAPAERWQRRVWRALFDDDRRARVEGDERRHMLLPDAALRIAPGRLDLPSRLHVFGLSYVAPAFAGIFARLARATDLRVYAQNPCLEFWEDVQAASGLAQLVVEHSRFARRGAGGADVERAEDPFGLEAPGDTPALRLWGRPGREYVRLLDHLTGCDFDALFIDPGERSLLARLQRDVLLRRPERARAADAEDGGAPGEAEDNGSIRFLACPGVRREVEIVADEIWRLLAADDEGGGDLRFHQIAVMVTDANRATYLTHIESVFRARHGIPVNVIDRRLSGRSRVVDAALRLVDLPLGRLEAAEVVRLLVHPLVGAADPDVDATRWRDWVRALGVRFGADRSDHEDTYFDRDVFHWDQAVRRLALGAFVTGEHGGDERVFEAFGDRWLPHETGATADAARFVSFVRRLVADARAFRSARMPMRQWSSLLVRLVGTYIQPHGEVDEMALDRCVRAFEALGEADLEATPVPFAVAHSLARGALAALDSQLGQHQADGVVVSSLLPMRAIPFEVVFVLGLGEGEFPARARHDPVDLRQARRVAGDVSAAERDRYLFLETLLAARSRVVLSYVGRDASTGEPREPSSVVRELQYVLRSYASPKAIEAMTVSHPVAAHDVRYFEGELATTSDSDARAATAVALRQDVMRFTGQPDAPDAEMLARVLPGPVHAALPRALHPPPQPDEAAARAALGEIQLPLYAVQRFLESPLQGAARFSLGLYGDDGAEGEDSADEPLALERRLQLDLLQRAFWSAEPEAAWRAAFEREVLRGAAPVGPIAERRTTEDLAVLGTWQSNVAAAGLPPREDWLTVRVARAREHEAVDVWLPVIRLEVPVGAGQVVPVALHGALQPLHPDGTTTLRGVLAAEAGAHHFLPGFLTLATMCASEMPPPGDTFAAIVTPARAETDPHKLLRTYRVPTGQACRRWLTDVLQDLLADVHEYRLPIQAVLRWKQARIDDRRARLRVGRSMDDADGWGPVRDPDRYKAPDEPVAEAMVLRRFGLWFRSEVASQVSKARELPHKS